MEFINMSNDITPVIIVTIIIIKRLGKTRYNIIISLRIRTI